MIALLIATTLAFQTPPSAQPSPDTTQAQGQAAVDGMVRIFTTLGSCERHFTPEQVQGIRRGFEPEPGQTPSAFQAHLAGAYERGKTDTSLSAPACREIMRALAESKNSTPRAE